MSSPPLLDLARIRDRVGMRSTYSVDPTLEGAAAAPTVSGDVGHADAYHVARMTPGCDYGERRREAVAVLAQGRLVMHPVLLPLESLAMPNHVRPVTTNDVAKCGPIVPITMVASLPSMKPMPPSRPRTRSHIDNVGMPMDRTAALAPASSASGVERGRVLVGSATSGGISVRGYTNARQAPVVDPYESSSPSKSLSA